MPNINLLQNTTGEDPKPKEKKTPPPPYTQPPAEAPVPEPNLEKKLSPLGSFFNTSRPAAPSVTPSVSAKPLIRPEKKNSRGSRAAAEPALTKPAGPKRSWLGGVFNFARSQPKITEERIEPADQLQPSILSGGGPKANRVHGQKILEEKVVTKRTGSRPLPGGEAAEYHGAGQSSLGVNLMPDDMMSSLEPKKKLVTYLIVLLISAGIVAGGYGGLVWYENRIYDQADQTTKQVEQVNNKIAALRSDQQKAVLFKSQTDAIRTILDQHVYWTQFFARLEKYTMPDVEYQSFSGSFTPGVNPVFSISAVTNTYDSVARQILGFRQAVEKGDFISAALIDSGNQLVNKESEQETVQFTVQINTLEKVFYKRVGDLPDTNNQ